MICEKQRHGADEWICDRCRSLWTDMLAETGWFPDACPSRARPEASVVKNINEQNGVETQK